MSDTREGWLSRDPLSVVGWDEIGGAHADHEDAAERWAVDVGADAEGPGPHMVVVLSPEGEERFVRVDVEWDPVFYVSPLPWVAQQVGGGA